MGSLSPSVSWSEPPGVTSPRIFEVMMGILEGLRLNVYPSPKRIVLAPGTSVPWDGCCDGYLYGQVMQVTPLRNGVTCYGYSVRAKFGHLRCVSVVDDQGRPPKTSKMNTESLILLTHMDEMRETLESSECVVSVDSWTPLGPDGGCAGGEWTAMLHL